MFYAYRIEDNVIVNEHEDKSALLEVYGGEEEYGVTGTPAFGFDGGLKYMDGVMGERIISDLEFADIAMHQDE